MHLERIGHLMHFFALSLSNGVNKWDHNYDCMAYWFLSLGFNKLHGVERLLRDSLFISVLWNHLFRIIGWYNIASNDK